MRPRAWGGLLLLAALLASALPAAASTRAQRRLDEVVQAIEQLRIPGGVIGVTGGRVGSYERAFGLAAPNQPMKLNDHFRIGSVTKTFTATVILELVDRGMLHLSDPLSKWEPAVPNARRITIRMLLNMTSGIWDEGGTGPGGKPSLLSQWIGKHCGLGNPLCSQKIWSPQELVNLAIRQGAAYPPGVWYYSDTNYAILAIIAQDVTGEPFAQLLRRLVLRPLHLRHTSFPTSSVVLPTPATTGYEPNSLTAPTQYVPGNILNPSALFGAGNIVSTLGDLEVWARALGTGALLKPATQRLRLKVLPTDIFFLPLAKTGLTTGLVGGYGLGLADLGHLLGHNGVVDPPGYTSDLWYLPSEHATFVVLFNSIALCADGAPIADASLASISQAVFGADLYTFGSPIVNQCPAVNAPG